MKTDELQLPWFLQEYTDEYTNIVRPKSADGQIICYSSSGEGRRKQMEFVVDACNSHIELKSENERLRQQLHDHNGMTQRKLSEQLEKVLPELNDLKAENERYREALKEIVLWSKSKDGIVTFTTSQERFHSIKSLIQD